MNPHGVNTLEIRELFEQTEQEQIAGAAAQPQYLLAVDPFQPMEEVKDKDGICLSSSTANSAQTSVISPAGQGSEEQYIANTSEYHRALCYILSSGKTYRFGLKDLLAKAFAKSAPEKSENTAAAYQEKVDDLADDQSTQELLNQILEEYARKHGKSVEDLTQEEIIEAVREYLDEHFDYEWEENNKLGDFEKLVNDLLKGEKIEGDCEEYAILLAALLKAAGINAELGFVDTSGKGEIDHVVVIVGNQILDINPYSNLSLKDILLRTTHNEDGEVVVVDGNGNVVTQNEEINTHAGSEGAGGSSGMGRAVDAANSVEEDMDKKTLEFSEENYLQVNEYGYYEPDEKKLEEWAMYVLKRSNVLNALMIAIFSQFEAKRIADEIFSGTPREPEGRFSAKKAVARKVQSLMKIVQTGIVKVAETANKRNEKIYQDRMSDYQDKMKGCYKFVNVLTIGEWGRQVELGALKETKKYYDTTQRTLLALQKANEAVIKFITESMEGSGLPRTLGMLSGLKKLNKRLEEMNKDIDAKTKEIDDMIDELDNQGFFKNFLNLFEGAFKAIAGIFSGIYKGLKDGDWSFSWFREGLGQVLNAYKNLTLREITLIFDFISLVFKGLDWLFDKLFNSKYSPLYYISWADPVRWFTKGEHNIFYIFNILSKSFGSVADTVDWFNWKLDLQDGFINGDFWNKDLGGGLGSILKKRWHGDDDDQDGGGVFNYQIIDIQQIIKEYRGEIIASQNAFRMYLSLKLFRTDLRNTVRETFTGISGVENNAELLMISVEAMFGNVLRTFDKIASQMMRKVSINNQMVALAKGLNQANRAQMMSFVAMAAMVAAIVLSIISIFFPPASAATLFALKIAALACSALSAMATAMASYISAQVSSYTPIEPNYEVQDTGWATGGVVLKGLHDIEKSEEAMTRAAARNQGMYIQTKDELYTFNSKAFAAYEMRINALNNAIRMIFSLLKNARDMRRVALAEFTGISVSDSGDALLQNAVNNILSQRLMILSAIKFQIQEKITALNIKVQSEIRAGKAGGGALAYIGGAILGLLLSFIPGLGAAWQTCMAIGGALGNAAWMFYDAGWGEGNARGADLKDTSGELEKVLTDHGNRSVEDKLDQAETAAYRELLANGLVSAGDGYMAVNSGLVTKTFARIAAIYTAKEVLARVRAMASELRAIAKQQMGGVVPATGGDLALIVNQANFANAMRVAGSIVSFLQARAAVLNRARDAEKNWIMQCSLLPIQVALAAAGYTGIALTETGTLLNNIFLATPSVMSLVNAVASLVSSVLAAKSSMGYFENYDAKTAVDQAGKKVKNAQTIDEKIDQAEYEEMLKMNEELIVTLDGTTSGVGAASAKSFSRVSQLNNIRVCLAIVRSIRAEARKAAGARILTSDYGRDFVEQYRQASLAMLDALKNALESIAERKSQQEEAEKGIWLASINVAFSLAAIGCSIVAGIHTGEALKAEETQKAGAADQDGLKEQAVSEGEKALKWNRWATALNFASSLLTSTLALTYDTWKSGDRNSSHTRKEEKSQAQGAVRRQALTSKEESKSIFTSFDEMDSESYALDYDMASIENRNRVAALSAARYEAFAFALLSLMKEFVQIFDGKNKQELPGVPHKHLQAAKMRQAEEAEQRFQQLEQKYDELMERASRVVSACESPSQACSEAQTDYQQALRDYQQELNDYKKFLAEQQNPDIGRSEGNKEFVPAESPPSTQQEELSSTLSTTAPKNTQEAIENVMKQFENKTADVCSTIARSVVDEATRGLSPQDAQKVREEVVQKLAERDPVKAARVAAALGINFTPPTQRATERFVAKEVKTPSTRALLDYANMIEQQMIARLNAATQQVDQLEAMATELDAEIEALQNGIETPQDLKEVLENLKAQRDALLAERSRLIQERQQLQQALERMQREELPRLQTAGQDELNEVKRQMTEISNEIANLESQGDLTPEQQAQLEALRSKMQTLASQKSALESALNLVDEKMAKVEQQLNALKTRSDTLFQKINELNQRIQQVQRQIASVQRQIDRQPMATATAAIASAKGGPSIFKEGVRRMFRSLFGSSEKGSGAEGSSADSGAEEVIVAVRNAGGQGSNRDGSYQGGESFHDQYKRALAEEEFYLRHTTGVSC